MRFCIFILVLLTFPASLHALESGTTQINVNAGKSSPVVDGEFLPEKIRLRFTQDFSFQKISRYSTTHVGLWRYICGQASRYFRSYLREDRERYIALGHHPYYAEKRYDLMVSRFARSKIYTAKAASPYFTVGRFSLGRDMRLKVHDRPRIRHAYRKSMVTRTSPSFFKTRFMLRARLNVKLRSSSLGVRTIGVRMTGLFVDKRGSKLPINVFMTAKHRVADSESIVFIGISV